MYANSKREFEVAAQPDVQLCASPQAVHPKLGAPYVADLCELAVDGLLAMFDPQSRLFCYRRKLTSTGMINEGVSHRYTVMALLGLLRWRAAGMQSPIDIDSAVARLLEHLTWINGIGDLGLLLWLCAEGSAKHLRKLSSSVNVEHALHKLRDARERKTTELAWFLAGIAHAVLAAPKEHSTIQNTASQTYELLKRNQRQSGIFGHLARRRSLGGALRGHIGCFADQVYPIYAIARYAEAFDNELALEAATSCADAICRLQGPLGQWWWHYDSLDGHVLGKYPVFSVHQHGMAPMALLALGDTAKRDWSGPVYKGLRWISGSNELDFDMQDAPNKVVWRDIQPGGNYTRYLATALDVIGCQRRLGVAENLRINFECRPYELGWLLYAFAGHNANGFQPA